jgi:hypothetical protein
MSRIKLADPRNVFPLRIPQSVIDDSKKIPAFRSRLERYAIDVHSAWSKKEELLKND